VYLGVKEAFAVLHEYLLLHTQTYSSVEFYEMARNKTKKIGIPKMDQLRSFLEGIFFYFTAFVLKKEHIYFYIFHKKKRRIYTKKIFFWGGGGFL
jgi:hypothetical protein